MRIVKRTLGNKEYYYLHHSIRKKDKIITKEKYLGKEIPQNIEEIQKKFLEECTIPELVGIFEEIKKNFQKEWKTYPESMKEKVRKQLAVDFTYNTNAIEGSTISLEETKELLEHQIAPHKPLRDIKESEAHAKLFLSLHKRKETITNQLLLHWHQEVFGQTKQDIAGKFREHPIRVGNYVAPDWQDVKKLMNILMHFYQKNKARHPVELAARMHYQFEKIHPFSDGNGRIGRLLMNYILILSGFPILIIEYKKRKSYYKALEKDEQGFCTYFYRRYIKAHKRYTKK